MAKKHVPEIGTNGNWYIMGEDTGKPSWGETGPAGDKGAIGDAGSKGIIGDTGAKGETGLQGSQGEQGPKGETGDTGAKGEACDYTHPTFSGLAAELGLYKIVLTNEGHVGHKAVVTNVDIAPLLTSEAIMSLLNLDEIIAAVSTALEVN